MLIAQYLPTILNQVIVLRHFGLQNFLRHFKFNIFVISVINELLHWSILGLLCHYFIINCQSWSNTFGISASIITFLICWFSENIGIVIQFWYYGARVLIQFDCFTLIDGVLDQLFLLTALELLLEFIEILNFVFLLLL